MSKMSKLATKLSGLCVKKHIEDSNSECPVCFERGDDIIYLNCNHFFHAKCIVEWISSSNNLECPMCRTKIKKIILSDISLDYYSQIPKNQMKDEIDNLIKILSIKSQSLVLLFFIRSLMIFSLIHGRDKKTDELMKKSKIFYHSSLKEKQKRLIKTYNDIYEENL